MLQKKVLLIIAAGLLSAGLSAQNSETDSSRCYIGSSAFMLVSLTPASASFYQLNFGYWLSFRDVISLEAITWKYDAPLGIPYGPSMGDSSEKYPGSIREYGVGIVYQRFLWKGLYSSLQALPLRRVYQDEYNKTIGKGFQLFSTFRLGYHIRLARNRFFIEPSIAATCWPISTHVPASFAEKDKKWPRYFLFEPGLHLGFKF